MVENEIAATSMAHTDPLTGLGNRRGFEAAAAVVVDINRRRRLDTTVLYFDLDQFKLINDRFGHAEGDRALREFAQILSGVLRGSDVLARLGGDEFVALLSGANSYESVAERMRAALEERNRGGGHPFDLATSMGGAVMSWDSTESLDSLLHRADEAMYEQKRRR